MARDQRRPSGIGRCMHLDAPVRRTVGFGGMGGGASWAEERGAGLGDWEGRPIASGTTARTVRTFGARQPRAPRNFCLRPERVRARATSHPHPKSRLTPSSPLPPSLPPPACRPKAMASRAFSRLAPALSHARSARPVGARIARAYATQSEHTVCSVFYPYVLAPLMLLVIDDGP